MRRKFSSVCAACGLAAGVAFAHNLAETGVKPHASSSAASHKAGTHDPRAYFTDAKLLTQDGREVRFYSEMLHGRVVVLNVMYASCTDACPLITRQLNKVRGDLGELFASKVFFVSITSDPARDTPRAIKKFARAQHADVPGWTFLTGSRSDIETILARLGALPASADEHETQLFIMDVDRRRMRRMLPNLPPKAIAEAARLIAAAEL